MLDVVTSVLEIVAVVLIVVAGGWLAWLLVPVPINGPAALIIAAGAALAVSTLLGAIASRNGADEGRAG